MKPYIIRDDQAMIIEIVHEICSNSILFHLKDIDSIWKTAVSEDHSLAQQAGQTKTYSTENQEKIR